MADVSMSTSDRGKGTESKKWEGHMIPGLSRDVMGFPKSIVTKLRYVDNITFTSTSGSVNLNNFRANSIFDPDQTSTGHQPMFLDIYTQVYNNYRVLGSKIKCIFTAFQEFGTAASDVTSTRGPWAVGINGTTGTASVASGPRTRMEMNEGDYRILNTRTGEDGVQIVEHDYDPERRLGRFAADDVVSAAVGGNPSNPYYWQVWVADLAATTSTVFCNVYIEYTVEFFQPSVQPES